MGDFTKLRDRISELVEMMGEGRRSIHQAMQDLLASILSLHQQNAKHKVAESKQKVRTNDRSTQTILQQQTPNASMRQRDELDKPGKTSL